MKKILVLWVLGVLSAAIVGIKLESIPDRSPVAFQRVAENKYEQAQEQTVTVRVGSGSGSGVVFKRSSTNGVRVFVWTANHVVDDTNTAKVVRTIHFGAAKHTEISFQARVIARLPRY